ncbi:transmembrane protein 234 homolog isoform X2 [Portunus trituberculatus]|uniref:transmembrane protein 234 homolog isoform X2 n=1 Tax=Portunus trituberculatus TaxID=210409 RepID=UPI001E1D135D|nr:transmembrane protein 234 homolog isoform X2 [Portunus trituberculatus]
MVGMELLFCLLAVSLLWGITNPLLKRASVGIEDIKMSNPVLQLGSVLFVYTLGNADLSLAVPLSNSLTFLVTTVAGRCLGEDTTSRTTWIGAGLVCVGVALCVADKTQH